jgi:hypothetical protein
MLEDGPSGTRTATLFGAIIGHTPANHDARADLTCLESTAPGRVHRLDPVYAEYTG